MKMFRAVALLFALLASGAGEGGKDYIKWIDFNIPYEVLKQAYEYDVKSQDTDTPLDFVSLLAYGAAKNWGEFKQKGRCAAIDKVVERLRAGELLNEITADMELFDFYFKAYGAVLGDFVGPYEIDGERRYGLKAFSPLAKGFNFSHSDDFGNPRSYGYRRRHLGHDMFGSVGAPVIAVEGGVVEALGWNRYGGWRVGIRSADGARYYYYAHLRRGRPYAEGLEVGKTVAAGDVIGYLGATGYSYKEDVNNIKIPHLHFGIQIIFDESQKDGNNQIWIDPYAIVRFLHANRMEVERGEDGEYRRKVLIDAVPME